MILTSEAVVGRNLFAPDQVEYASEGGFPSVGIRRMIHARLTWTR